MRATSPLAGALVVLVLALGACAAPGSQPAAGPTGSGQRGPSSVPAARVPSDLLDLRNWYLTLPTGAAGDPDTVQQPALGSYTSSWFHLDDARDGVVFTADAGGVTTSGSNYPRSELREMDGGRKASWSNTSGTHTLELRQAVLTLPPVKPQVVTAQIHDAVSDVVEVRLQGTRLIAQYADGTKDVTLDAAYVLGTAYDLRIVAAAGRIDVYYDGVPKAQIQQSGSQWYFKTGSYLQSNTDKGDQPDALGQVVLYAVRVTHSG